MVKVPVYNPDGSFNDLLEIDETAFGTRIHKVALKETIVAHLAAQRRGTHSTRTRGEVAGSRSKPYAQKGTGRARAGSYQSPIWKGGGIVFGPKPRDYRQGLPKKVRRLARASAILGRLRDGEIGVITSFELGAPVKTKHVAKPLARIDAGTDSWLIGCEATSSDLYLAARNMPRVKVLPVAEWNAYEILRPRRILVTRAGLDLLLAIAKGEVTGAPAPAVAESTGAHA